MSRPFLIISCPDHLSAPGLNIRLWITPDTPGPNVPPQVKFPWQYPGVIWGIRSPEGRLYLVADDMAADVIEDEWARADSQLVVRQDVYAEWRPARWAEQRLLRARAQRARRGRQAIQGLMRPEARPTVD